MNVVANARALRRRMTEPEKRLWFRLNRKQLGVRFRRQQPIRHYVADFVCFEKRLVVELDGGQHGEEKGRKYDARRTAFLNSQGFTVIRFWNNEVMKNIEGVMERIVEYLKSPHGSSAAGGLDSPAPPQGGSESAPGSASRCQLTTVN